MGNAQPYTFSWNSETIHEDITYPIDTLDRARYASFLTNFLIAEANNGGYVLNINAPWGTGKTYFLNRWLIDLKEKHPVVYIDAWKQDFSNDPMLSVVSSIINQLQALLPKEDKTISDTLGKASEFMKAIAPIVAKGVMKKATGIDLNDDGEHDLSKADEAMLGDIAAKVTDKMIKNHNTTLNSIVTFKIAIKEWIEAIQVKSKLNTPTFIFIDELDRCRPTYAVQMLEVIKHFFEMDNIIFVVATDTEQLQHVIKAVYGQGFDAQTYLGRFFHRRCTLRNVSKLDFVNNYLTQETMSDISQKNIWPNLLNKKDFATLIVQLDYLYNFSLRDLEQLIDKVIATVLFTELRVNLIILILFFMVYEKDKVLFNSMMDKRYFIDSVHPEGVNSFLEDSKAYIFNFLVNSRYIIFQSSKVGTDIEKVTLEDILQAVYNSFNSFNSFNSNELLQQEKINSLKSIGNPLNSRDKKKLIAQEIYESTVGIENYKNWVELAVSFDG